MAWQGGLTHFPDPGPGSGGGWRMLQISGVWAGEGGGGAGQGSGHRPLLLLLLHIPSSFSSASESLPRAERTATLIFERTSERGSQTTTTTEGEEG